MTTIAIPFRTTEWRNSASGPSRRAWHPRNSCAAVSSNSLTGRMSNSTRRQPTSWRRTRRSFGAWHDPLPVDSKTQLAIKTLRKILAILALLKRMTL